MSFICTAKDPPFKGERRRSRQGGCVQAVSYEFLVKNFHVISFIHSLFRFASLRGGRCRALPVADAARQKEWPRSKFGERRRVTNFGHRNRGGTFLSRQESTQRRRRRRGAKLCLSLPFPFRSSDLDIKPPSPTYLSRPLRVVVTTMWSAFS